MAWIFLLLAITTGIATVVAVGRYGTEVAAPMIPLIAAFFPLTLFFFPMYIWRNVISRYLYDFLDYDDPDVVHTHAFFPKDDCISSYAPEDKTKPVETFYQLYDEKNKRLIRLPINQIIVRRLGGWFRRDHIMRSSWDLVKVVDEGHVAISYRDGTKLIGHILPIKWALKHMAKYPTSRDVRDDEIGECVVFPDRGVPDPALILVSAEKFTCFKNKSMYLGTALHLAAERLFASRKGQGLGDSRHAAAMRDYLEGVRICTIRHGWWGWDAVYPHQWDVELAEQWNVAVTRAKTPPVRNRS